MKSLSTLFIHKFMKNPSFMFYVQQLDSKLCVKIYFVIKFQNFKLKDLSFMFQSILEFFTFKSKTILNLVVNILKMNERK